MHTFTALLIVVFAGCAAYALLRMWREYDLSERLHRRIRRAIGATHDEQLEQPIRHTCLTHVRTRAELLDNSEYHSTVSRQTCDYELRRCDHCGSIFIATTFTKPSTHAKDSHD